MNFKQHITARNMNNSFWQLTGHCPGDAEAVDVSLVHENIDDFASFSLSATHEQSLNIFDELTRVAILHPA